MPATKLHGFQIFFHNPPFPQDLCNTETMNNQSVSRIDGTHLEQTPVRDKQPKLITSNALWCQDTALHRVDVGATKDAVGTSFRSEPQQVPGRFIVGLR